jgi:hypothetical protein
LAEVKVYNRRVQDDSANSLLSDGRRVAWPLHLLGEWLEGETVDSTEEQRALMVGGLLWQAAEVLLDELFEDAAELAMAKYEPETWRSIVTESRVLSALPRRFHHRVAPGTANRFLIVTVDLVSRLSYGWQPCACTGQELMLWALLGEAQMIEDTHEVDLGDWHEYLTDALFEDLDFEYLFDDSLDGFEDDETATGTRAMNMRFDEWFKPFGTRRLPPYVEMANRDGNN